MDSRLWYGFGPPAKPTVAYFQTSVEFPMRTILLACACAVLPLNSLLGQSLSDVIPSEKRTHDFGAVAKASKAEYRFQLFNPFSSDLFIQGVRTTCGCTTPIVEKQVIPPGETGTVLARFNTDRFNGEKQATLTVSISRPYSTELQLNVKGYIRTDVVLSPGEAAFGSVPEGADRRLSLQLSYAGRSDWQILRISSPFPFVQSEFNEVSRGGGRVQYSIDVELLGSAPEGHLNNQLVIHTNDRRLKMVPIQLSASIERPLKTSPAFVSLGKVKPKEALSQRITMTSKSEFLVLNLTSDCAEIQFEPPQKPSRIHIIRALIRPMPDDEFIDGELKGKIRVHTDLSDEPFEIPLSFELETDKLADAQSKP
jgi:hypothetical protein